MTLGPVEYLAIGFPPPPPPAPSAEVISQLKGLRPCPEGQGPRLLNHHDVPGRTMQRTPRCEVEVSTGCAMRAAGR